ncbi:MAG: hypothetical protein JRE23_00080 [Deltaproteobacteria bacterium]|nr:hypothetical protein [Deltaproteobacteria bacterium]
MDKQSLIKHLKRVKDRFGVDCPHEQFDRAIINEAISYVGKDDVAEVACSVGLCGIAPYDLECLAMAIVNHVNERTGVDVKKRQETNDENFDHVIKQIKTFLKGLAR